MKGFLCIFERVNDFRDAADSLPQLVQLLFLLAIRTCRKTIPAVCAAINFKLALHFPLMCVPLHPDILYAMYVEHDPVCCAVQDHLVELVLRINLDTWVLSPDEASIIFLRTVSKRAKIERSRVSEQP